MSAAPIRCPELGGCENRAQCWEPCGFLGKSAAHARPASAETTAAVNAALTTQPAGALPEPVHFRALLDDAQRPQQLNSAMHVCGFRDRRTAENWVASKLDFDHWRYTLEPLYAEADMRAMMAERDAARAQRDAIHLCYEHLQRCHDDPPADLQERVLKSAGLWDIAMERDALRQSLWDVYAALGCDTDGDPTPAALVGDLGEVVLAAAKEAAKDYREACDAIPPDAREGREPLTDAQLAVLRFLWGSGVLRGASFGTAPEGERAPYWWRRELVEAFPELAGNSADGETR